MKNLNSLERLTRLLMVNLFLGVIACKEEVPGEPPMVSADPDLDTTVSSTVALAGFASYRILIEVG